MGMGTGPHQVLAATWTLFQPGEQIVPTKYHYLLREIMSCGQLTIILEKDYVIIGCSKVGNTTMYLWGATIQTYYADPNSFNDYNICSIM